jgi:hypothetical protein
MSTIVVGRKTTLGRGTKSLTKDETPVYNPQRKMYWPGDQTTHHVHDNCTSKQYDVENSEKNKELHLEEHVIVNSN